jgi:HlyD family secretion protein
MTAFRRSRGEFAAICILTAIILSLAPGCSDSGKDGIRASGTIEVIDVTISAKVPGVVEKRFVDEGSVVKPGDTVAYIRHLTAPLEMAQGRAAVAAARAKLDLLLRGSRAEDIAQAKATADRAAKDLERAGELHDKQLLSDQEFNYAHTAFVVADEAYKKLVAGPLPEEIGAARAALEQAIAAVNLTEQKLTDSWVTSPVAGVVTLRAAEAGELVQAGASIVRVSVLDSVRLVIYVAETELGKIRLGDEARVTIDTFPDRTFKGRVIYVSPTAEFTPKNVQTKEERVKLSFAVKIEVENPGGELKPGMPADAHIPDASR